MAYVVQLTFNPFQENTFLVYDESGECAIFDPGCYTYAERMELAARIESLNLRPKRLINTHCHLDHIFGNRFVAERYGLELEIHRGELPVLEAAEQTARFFEVRLPDTSPPPGAFIEADEEILFGDTSLRALLTPGHSPASLSFYCEADKFVIAGDVLFQGSIGRTDLPGGDMATLMASIKEQLLPLGDEVRVFCGHGPSTTIGEERRYNPFLREMGVR
jgi:hydroxyacylglutathione hydrolase